VEIDFKPRSFHVTSVLARRYEAYHEKLTHPAPHPDAGSGEGPKTIHDIVRVKEPGLEKKLQYDRYPRFSFLDHFLGDEVDLAAFSAQTYRELGWFAGARYKTGKPDFSGARDMATVPLTRTAEVEVAPGRREPIEVEKLFTFARNKPSLTVRWRITNRGGAVAQVRFASEVNLSLLAGDADDRFFDVPGATLGDKKLKSAGETTGATAIDLVDRWSGFRIALRFPAAALWRYPVETVNQSEGGFEATYQGSCLAPVWALVLEPGKTVEREISLSFGDA
jgi:alpha-amylase